MKRPAQRRYGVTFVGRCTPFEPFIGFDRRVPLRWKAQARNANTERSRILPPIGKVADEKDHVFISLQGYDKKVGQLFEDGHSIVFIRGGVATGKSTLAKHLARQFPEKYVNVPFTGGTEADWKKYTVKAVEDATGKKIPQDNTAFPEARKLAKEKDLTLIYDEAHTLFSSPTLCSELFKSNDEYQPKVLLFSATADASTGSRLVLSTPNEIRQKYMWTPPLSTLELEEQLEEVDVRLDQKSIEFFTQFCGGHRGIFIAAMHWVRSKQTSGESWNFKQTMGFVRNSYGGGNWNGPQNEILGYLRESRAVRVNGQYQDVSNIPREFVELLCKGSTTLPQVVRRDLCIHGFVLPKYSGAEGEFQRVDWTNEETEYRAANPLLASYYFYNLEKKRSLEVRFEPSKPQHCADLLTRALPYLLFCRVVSFEANTSELAKDGLPSEEQYNEAICTTLKDMKYQPVSTKKSRKGEGKPDIALDIDEERFVLEGVKFTGKINEHLRRFKHKTNYKNAKHKGLYIIGNDKEKMLDTLKSTEADDVQVIGLVPNIAHTAYTVHVKSKGINSINTFNVDCDLVARRLVLKDNGEPELYSVQSLKSVKLSPTAQPSTSGTMSTPPSYWVRQLREDDGTFTEIGAAFQVKGDLKNVDDLKEAIKKKKPNRVSCDADEITIYSKNQDAWVKEKKMSASLRETDETDCYGFTLPSA